MDEQEIKLKFEKIEERLNKLEEDEINLSLEKNNDVKFAFGNKKKEHNLLLEDLLKSDFCHNKNGLTKEEIFEIFKKNGRPIVPRKIVDLLNKWVQRKKIEVIKEEGKSKYFWIENEKPNKSN